MTGDWHDEPWRIYFLRCGRHIKIGRTQRAIPVRAAEVRSDRCGRFVPEGRYHSLGHIVGSWDLEGQLHTRFKHLRVRRTEWFRMKPDLLEFIAENAVEPLGRVA